jgi:hypothetical protein
MAAAAQDQAVRRELFPENDTQVPTASKKESQTSTSGAAAGSDDYDFRRGYEKATSRYVKSVGGDQKVWATPGKDGKTYNFETRTDGTTVRISAEDYKDRKRVGAHKLDIGTAERIAPSGLSEEQQEAIRALLASPNNLRSKTNAGNLRGHTAADSIGEERIRNHLDGGDSLRWCPAVGAKLKQYQDFHDTLATNATPEAETVNALVPDFQVRVKDLIADLSELQPQ